MSEELHIPTMAELVAENRQPEILFWVGCAGSFDDKAKRIIRAFARILNKAKVNFAVLGTEESCTGDPAKRAGNEFLFQMQAVINIQTLESYGIKKIVTACPHCFNTLKNEYPSLGGNYQVLHHTQFLQQLIEERRIVVEGGEYKGQRITFHDPCYLGRANGEYEAPRKVLQRIESDLIEMKTCKNKAMCCGAGGAQMFKEAEKGTQEINTLRTEQATETHPQIIATACPFCNTMLTDGVKNKNKEKEIKVYDIAEIINQSIK